MSHVTAGGFSLLCADLMPQSPEISEPCVFLDGSSVLWWTFLLLLERAFLLSEPRWLQDRGTCEVCGVFVTWNACARGAACASRTSSPRSFSVLRWRRGSGAHTSEEPVSGTKNNPGSGTRTRIVNRGYLLSAHPGATLPPCPRAAPQIFSLRQTVSVSVSGHSGGARTVSKQQLVFSLVRIKRRISK